MSVKSKGRKLGRMLRQVTGLPLPVCMKVGKMVAQGKSEYDIERKFPETFKIGSNSSCECCSYPTFTMEGPKGSVEGNYYFSAACIEKEYIVTTKLRSVPMGTVVTYP